MKQVRHDILSELSEKRIQSTAESERQSMGSRGPELLHLIRETGFNNLAFDDILSFDINSETIKPGMIYDDIDEHIQDNNLTEQWGLAECEDEADDIIDDDEEGATRGKHIRLTIKPDQISDTEERDDVKGFDSETVVEIKFFKKDE